MNTYIKILLLLCSTAYGVHAQNYAYFYIEGDQETPFYVKVEGQMQERFGQNHFIIPKLDAGYTHFEILFQKNVYPPQEFLLEVPKGGSRGFVLHKVNDRQFALYDLQQHRYIVSGNTKEEDHAPNIATYLYSDNTVSDTGVQHSPEINTGSTNLSSSEPQFLSGIELNTTRRSSNAPPEDTARSIAEQRITRKVKRARGKTANGDNLAQLPALRYDDSAGITLNSASDNQDSEADSDAHINIPNTDCPNAMSNDAFENFALKFIDQSDDNKKLRLLRKHRQKLCFSTEQVRIITKNLETQSARYEAVKMLYPQTTDQEHFSQLESLFNTPFLKAKFNEIVAP